MYFRKFMLLIMVLALALAPVQAFAQTPSPDAIINEWMKYAYAMDGMMGAELWALDYAGKYLESGSWDDLVMARMAAEAALRFVLAEELPAAELDAADYVDYMAAGYDLSFISLKLSALEEERNMILIECINLNQMLRDDVFWKYDREHLAEWVKNMLAVTRCMLECMGNETNYICVAAGDEQDAAQAFFRENCPAMFECYTTWLDDAGTLEKNLSDMLKEYEGLASNKARLESVEMANLDAYIYAAESGDWSYFAKDWLEIPGCPAILPDPGWSVEHDVLELYFYMDEETGALSYANAGQVLEKPADCHLVSWADVSGAEFEAYRATLKACGIEAFSEKETEAGVRMFYTLNGMEFTITYEAGEVEICMLSGPVLIAPEWYMMARAGILA